MNFTRLITRTSKLH